MRIAFAFEGALPSTQADAEVFLNTASAMSRRGHDVSLSFASSPKRGDAVGAIRDYFDLEGQVRFVPVDNPFDHKTLQHGWQALRSPWLDHARSCDVLYTRNIVILAAAIHSGALVFYDHYRPLPDQTPALQPLLRRWMTHPRFLGMACHSDLTRKSFLRIGVPPERLRVVYNGFDPGRMPPDLSKAQARQELGWDPARPTIVYTGRVGEHKGLEIVLDMARHLPHMDFVLVGSSRDANRIEQEARAIPNVRLVEWQPPGRLAAYLYAADVVVIPPSDEPLREFGRTVLPLKVFTYLATGRPLLAADTPDLREVLEHGRNAWLVPPGDVAQAVEATRRLCEDVELGATIAARARADSREFTWDARAARLDAFLAERISAPRVWDATPAWSLSRWLRECVRGGPADHESSGVGS